MKNHQKSWDSLWNSLVNLLMGPSGRLGQAGLGWAGLEKWIQGDPRDPAIFGMGWVWPTRAQPLVEKKFFFHQKKFFLDPSVFGYFRFPQDLQWRGLLGATKMCSYLANQSESRCGFSGTYVSPGKKMFRSQNCSEEPPRVQTLGNTHSPGAASIPQKLRPGGSQRRCCEQHSPYPVHL